MTEEKQEKEGKRRSKISQSDVPAYSIEHALRVPLAIAENYASKPTKPFDVAAAMSLLPNSTQFRMLPVLPLPMDLRPVPIMYPRLN